LDIQKDISKLMLVAVYMLQCKRKQVQHAPTDNTGDVFRPSKVHGQNVEKPVSISLSPLLLAWLVCSFVFIVAS